MENKNRHGNFSNQLFNVEDHSLIAQLKTLIQTERKITSEVIEHIQEVDRRKLYLQFGFTSLFAYLTEEFGYTPASAQRRIDVARIAVELPQITEDLKSGALNLTQVSMIAQGLRQKKKELKPNSQGKNNEAKLNALTTSTDQSDVISELKHELLNQIKGQSLEKTQTLIAQSFDLEVRELEKKRIQKDESVRVETTFSKEEMGDLERVKEIFSHTHPNLNFRELVNLLAQEVLKRKDPLRKVNSQNKEVAISTEDTQRTVTSAAEAEMRQSKATKIKTNAIHLQENKRSHVGNSVRRLIFHRDESRCKWRDINTGKICGSRYQIQVDHKKSVYNGGGNEAENLQLLCSVHNRLKYELETKTLSDQTRDYVYCKTG